MKWYKSFKLCFIVFSNSLANAQSAKQIFYELTFKTTKDSAKTEKHILS